MSDSDNLFGPDSGTEYPLQTSCSEPDSETEDKDKFVDSHFRDLDMTDLFREVRRSKECTKDQTTPRSSGYKGKEKRMSTTNTSSYKHKVTSLSSKKRNGNKQGELRG